jgi:hypothetical protein
MPSAPPTTILPFRQFAEKGILHDPSPYELDLNAFSGGANMRFHANRAEASPIFRQIATLTDPPAFCVARRPSSGFDSAFAVGTDQKIYQYTTGSVADVSPLGSLYFTISNPGAGYTSPPTITVAAPGSGTTATAVASLGLNGVVSYITLTNVPSGYSAGSVAVTVGAPPSGGTQAVVTALWVPFSASTVNTPFTATFLGDVTYINNQSGQPYFYGPSSTVFQQLPNWSVSWNAASVRAFSDYLVAFNVTKGGVSYPNMVKWSDITLAGSPPISWNANDATTNAGENILEQLDTPIIDAFPLRNIMVIYASDQVWSMYADGSQEVFEFQRLFGDGGLINQNCVAEVEGIHYVFGTTDIYRHDSLTKVSLVDKLNRDYIFRNLNFNLVQNCFVLYMPALQQIMFAYPTGNSDAYFTQGIGCNQGFIYDIQSGTHAFIDLPNVTAATVMTLFNGPTYASVSSGLQYNNTGSSYYDEGNSFAQNIVMSSQAGGNVTSNRLLGYDFMNKGNLALPASFDCIAPAILERTGIDLDQIGSNLETYKGIRRLFPLVVIYDDIPLNVQVGSSMTPTGTVVWGAPVSFNPNTDYKVDVRQGGRFLAVRFTAPQPVDFEIAGFDADIYTAGRR